MGVEEYENSKIETAYFSHDSAPGLDMTVIIPSLHMKKWSLES